MGRTEDTSPARAAARPLDRRTAIRLGVLGGLALAAGCTTGRGGVTPGTTDAPPPTGAPTGAPPPRSGPAAAGRFYIAGDSTAANYAASAKPQAGWGQAFPLFVGGGATVSNQAIGGRSTRSFVEEGRLQRIVDAVTAQDMVLITFGHNDEGNDPNRHTDAATTYKAYLRKLVDGPRTRKARVVLLTPVERRHFDSSGHMTPTHRAYATAMTEVAKEKGVPLIDLTALSTALWNRLGPEATKRYFLWTGDKQDNTHFQARGAIEVARLVATALRDQQLVPASQLRQLTASIPDSALTWR